MPATDDPRDCEQTQSLRRTNDSKTGICHHKIRHLLYLLLVRSRFRHDLPSQHIDLSTLRKGSGDMVL